MREILFRGKQVGNGKWIEGGYYENNTGKYIISPAFAAYLIIPDTDCQFTGLTDKNGVKIFEGDIVRYGDTIHRVVFEQRNGTAYFGLVYAACETLPFGHYQDLKQIEVIGNIYAPGTAGGEQR